MNQPRRLSDIIGGSGSENDLEALWNSTEAAADYKPLPPGHYIVHLIAGEKNQSRNKGTPCFKMTFRVIEGPHANRQVWHEVWLTPKAIGMAKRDLAKIGITSPKQMEAPIPPGLRCKLHVVIHRDDDGTERNRLRDFEVIGRDTPEADPFAPEPPKGGLT
jgi:hypothetical protein